MTAVLAVTAVTARDGPPRGGHTACFTCRHFAGTAGEIEKRLPGLPALGSVYGSVRSADGLCRLHDRYLAAASYCASHEARAPDARDSMRFFDAIARRKPLGSR